LILGAVYLTCQALGSFIMVIQENGQVRF